MDHANRERKRERARVPPLFHFLLRTPAPAFFSSINVNHRFGKWECEKIANDKIAKCLNDTVYFLKSNLVLGCQSIIGKKAFKSPLDQ